MSRGTVLDPLLHIEENVTIKQKILNWRDSIISDKTRRNRIATALCLFLFLAGISGFIISKHFSGQETETKSSVVTSENGVVAADHEKCSEIGADVLGVLGGTAVDAAVAVAFCLGVVNPTSSGIGGGAFMVVGSSTGSVAKAYNMRETAPSAASQDMFKGKETEKEKGPLSIAVPGEVAGLYKAWENHGRVQWKLLVEPSIKLAEDGFEIGSHMAFAIFTYREKIRNDTGLKSVFTKGGELLKKGDKCKNLKLAETLKAVAMAEEPMKAFYEGDVAENLVKDVRKAGGIMTMEDLKDYKVNVTDAMVVDNVMGYKMLGNSKLEKEYIS